jgi:hypothetical protein
LFTGIWRRSKDSSFSEEKEAKRLFPFWLVGRVQTGKSFLVLFFKKEHAFFV